MSFQEIDGSLELVVQRVSAIPLTEMTENKAETSENAKNFITTLVLPQLAGLKSNRIGNVNGVVIPPIRISGKEKRPLVASSNLKRTGVRFLPQRSCATQHHD